jgi:hypothetical protein
MNNHYAFPCGSENPAKRPEVRKKISESKKGSKNPNWKPKVKLMCPICNEIFEVWPSQSNRKYCSRTCQSKMTCVRMKKNNPMYNEITRKQVSFTVKRRIECGEIIPWMCTQKGIEVIRELARERALNNNPMKNPEIMKKSFEGRGDRKSKVEEKFERLIEKYNLPIVYTGLGSLWLGNKNPDFKVLNQKKCIEIAISDFPYREEENYQEYAKSRISHFNKCKWDCLVIFLDLEKDEQKLVNKIKGFIN